MGKILLGYLVMPIVLLQGQSLPVAPPLSILPAAGRVTTIAHVVDRHEGRKQALWLASIGASVGGNVADVVTTMRPGLYEVNPLIGTGPNGQGVNLRNLILMKAGIEGGSILLQALMVRAHHRDGRVPDHRRAFTIENFIGAGVSGGIAAHNASLP